MREIKFRVWDRENERMYKVDELLNLWTINNNLDLDGTPVAVNQSYQWADISLQIDVNPLMQYTWLKDKNWVEIYEGDIVEYDYNNEWVWKNIQQIGWCYHFLWECETYWWNEDFSIIWNIYETPELLTNT